MTVIFTNRLEENDRLHWGAASLPQEKPRRSPWILRSVAQKLGLRLLPRPPPPPDCITRTKTYFNCNHSGIDNVECCCSLRFAFFRIATLLTTKGCRYYMRVRSDAGIQMTLKPSTPLSVSRAIAPLLSIQSSRSFRNVPVLLPLLRLLLLHLSLRSRLLGCRACGGLQNRPKPPNPEQGSREVPLKVPPDYPNTGSACIPYTGRLYTLGSLISYVATVNITRIMNGPGLLFWNRN